MGCLKQKLVGLGCLTLVLFLGVLIATGMFCIAWAEPETQVKTHPGIDLCAVVGVEKGDVLIIRSAPDPNSAQIGSVEYDEKKVSLLGPDMTQDSSQWRQVQCNGVGGWVNRRYLSCYFPPAEAKSIIANRADVTLSALKKRDMKSLQQYIHPVKGVRFSRHGNIIDRMDVVLSRRKIQPVFNDQKKRVWGKYDGSGEPIFLSFREYYDRFIYNRDYLASQQVGYNQVMRRGYVDYTSAYGSSNIVEVYPDAIIVEYLLTEDELHPWGSLRLIFQKLNERWFLVGLVHDGPGS